MPNLVHDNPPITKPKTAITRAIDQELEWYFSYAEPAGLGVRVDAAAALGTTISPDYDSMIAKLIVWAPTRAAARARLRRAIDEYRIAGVPTTLPFLRALNPPPDGQGLSV